MCYSTSEDNIIQLNVSERGFFVCLLVDVGVWEMRLRSISQEKWSPHRCSWMLVSSVQTLFFNSILQLFYDGDQHLSDINLRGTNISKTGCKIIDWTFNLTQNSPMAIYFCQTPPKVTHKETRTNHEMKMH